MPTGFRLGSVFQNLGPLPFQAPPKKMFSGKQPNFSGNCWRWGGSTLFFENKSSRNLSQNNFFPEISKIFSEEILHFLKMLQFQHARAPSPQIGPPFFTFLPPPPHTHPQVARPCFSLDTGIYVDDWKRARVIPIYKSEDRRKCDNYRPISILPIVSKVFERDVF